MRRLPRRVAAAALFLLCGQLPATAEELTIALSLPEVRIDSGFTGVALTVFGVIEGKGATGLPAGTRYDVAVRVEGPPETVVARRKDRFFAIWLNGRSETIKAPSFYGLGASADITAIADLGVRAPLQLGFDTLPSGMAADDSFRQAYLRLKQQAGLYTGDSRINFIGDSIFRTSIWIPANVPIGTYRVKAFLFADGKPLAEAVDGFLVSKIGFERFMSGFARNGALLYGLATVALALFTGWLAGVIFRRD
jgi:uncharacterized protein (TIGR02186 family)